MVVLSTNLNLPPLLKLENEAEYRQHFIQNYCLKSPMPTFDTISVVFVSSMFDHAFFESSNRSKKDKLVFSEIRAERMDWIIWVLINPSVELYKGWDNKRKCVYTHRRVAICLNDYCVTIEVFKPDRASFITAFPATVKTAAKIRSNPKWV